MEHIVTAQRAVKWMKKARKCCCPTETIKKKERVMRWDEMHTQDQDPSAWTRLNHHFIYSHFLWHFPYVTSQQGQLCLTMWYAWGAALYLVWDILWHIKLQENYSAKQGQAGFSVSYRQKTKYLKSHVHIQTWFNVWVFIKRPECEGVIHNSSSLVCVYVDSVTLMTILVQSGVRPSLLNPNSVATSYLI